MRVLFFGSGAFGQSTLRYLAHNHDVPLVITQPDRPAGRGRAAQPTPIREEAAAFDLEVLPCENVNAPDVTARLLALRADVAVVVAFGQKIGAVLRDGIPGRCINLHASLLPRYRGAAPIHHAILAGEKQTGVTAFLLEERMDTGPILTQRWTAIAPDETTAELHDRLAGIAVDALRGALDLYADTPCPSGTPQDHDAATLAPKLSKQSGFVDFAQPAAAIARQVRAMWSWPGASAAYVPATGAPVTVQFVAARVAEAPADAGQPPGVIDARRLVTTGDGALELLEVKPSGGRRMSWPDFVNGRRVQTGDCFRTPTG